MNTELHRVESIWRQMRDLLQRKKEEIIAEIVSYPTPIAGCDQQFNYLLEQRTAVVGELAQLQQAERASLAAAEPSAVLVEFTRASNSLNDEMKDAVQRQLQEPAPVGQVGGQYR